MIIVIMKLDNGELYVSREDTNDDLAARRRAYESVYGTPICDEERATDQTVIEYTTTHKEKAIGAIK